MDPVVAGFWGAFFGTVVLMLAASVAAFARSLQRVALMAGLSALVSALFVFAYLGWLPVGDADAHARLLAHVAIAAAVALGLMLLSLLGRLKQGPAARKAFAVMVGLGAAVVAAGWLLGAWQALLLSSLVAWGVGFAMLGFAVASAMRGDRLAWAAVSGVLCMLVAVAGLTWIALDPAAPWWAHAASAVSGMVYLAVMATALWSRYSYLLELAEVMAQGPSYDPVTRMRSHSETGQMIGGLFLGRKGDAMQVGVIAVTMSNLVALEHLFGRAAVNHALYVCASRLRRSAPADVDMGRLGEDGFLLLVRNASDPARLVEIGRQISRRLARPIELGLGRDPAQLDAGRRNWSADIGVGVLATSTQVRPSQAVATARAMSRTAWSYPSRLAWWDPDKGAGAEVPLQAAS
jgi:GGDEF domain-containing protein